MADLEVPVGDRVVMVRDGGDPHGVPVVHFHGTPGSRLEAGSGAEVGRRMGARVIGFDRPGYGGSDPAPTSLRLVARDVEAIADRLGLERFACLGWSGGGPFALAAAAVLGERVTRVGVSGGPGPVSDVPGARDALDANDLQALAYLPDAPDRAAEQFRAGNAELLDAMMSVREDAAAPWIDWQWAASDPDVVADAGARQALFASFREALRQGPMGIAWDNVAFVGPWGIRLEDVACPVHLWYGDRDAMVAPAHGEWLAEHLPHAELVRYPGEGHLLPLRHWEQMLGVLVRPV
ncbi:alpha/beta fold hydrolase [Nocardioides sp. dk4132]|uniref:alpha/beta fold hydrolase n=1 Tax=unclassified Nocardioides TaxID=2615069 RepID=UPI00129754E1|nr:MULTISPECIES: alpha/beta fold hydrolase [unclassified Nocardioides]MQW76505.1 alpha/beta fold hydrolase [Nocardioides sp. dk4132]QGA07234.1 alpha/beta fold hydrolase [Nocardioides sp. dk884]